jgi:hypothetical protein
MIKAGLTLAQMLRATKAVKSLPKAKITKLPQMPKKTGWRKSAFGKTFPNYSRYDLALDTSLLAGGYGIYKVASNKKKKKQRV